MAKKSRNIEQPSRKGLRATYRVINPNGAIPVARPASNIQLTPIVMPVSFIPYSSHAQPLLTDDEEYDY